MGNDQAQKWASAKIGNGQWGNGAMGNGQWAMGKGEWARGNGQWAMGKGEWAKGNGALCALLIVNLPELICHFLNSHCPLAIICLPIHHLSIRHYTIAQ